jgi:predicted nucleic acid-binding protein
MLAHYESGLRARDPLHLAICVRISGALTADSRMADAASANGVHVERVGR